MSARLCHVRGAFVLISLVACCGCQRNSQADADDISKPPKPVSVMTLRRSGPTFERTTTASVAAWKVERLGFEQAGRVVQVIEPNEMVGGPTGAGDQRPLAWLAPERFEIAARAAEADVAVADRRRDANQVAIDKRLPAQIARFQAELDLAEIERSRTQRLVRSKAAPASDLETAQTRASTARLQVESSKAELQQAQAEQLALDAQLEQAMQRLAEAKRNLANTTLNSSFPGQVTEVHVVPGTYVKEGDPVVTVQMIDPMLVEFEVTAADSRRYHRGDLLAVDISDRSGVRRTTTGMVYTVDTVADQNTRTFTVALHVRNEQEASVPTTDGHSNAIARTKEISPLNLGPLVTGDDRLLVERGSIHRVGDQDVVWRITNREWDSVSGPGDRLLTVEPRSVRVMSDVIPFLGTWEFVAVEFIDPKSESLAPIVLDRDLITGRLFFGDGVDEPTSLEDWGGNRVMLETPRWLLRAGDTVTVSTIPESSAIGFYIPMRAVRRENDQTFVHVVDASSIGQITEEEATPTVRRVIVDIEPENVVDGESLLLRIESTVVEGLTEGMQVVVGGTHYLSDGDRVRIVSPQEDVGGSR